MASIHKKSERKYKITVCNGYRSDGKKRVRSHTIDVPPDVPKRGILQYVHAQAEKEEQRMRYGLDQDERTSFEQYAVSWLGRQKNYKASTLEGYRRQLQVVFPIIGGIPLCKLRPINLEDMCEELRKRKTKSGEPIQEATVEKYLETVSAVLSDATKNDIIPYNPAHRVEKLRREQKQQRIPSNYEMEKLLRCILQEPLLYRVYYLIAISTGLRRGEICALRWSDLHEDQIVTVRHSRSSVPGQGIQESSTKNHRSRVVVLPLMVYDYLGDLFREQILNGVNAGWDGYIFQTENGPVHPDSFSRHLRSIYKQNGFPREYHLHTLRHFFATYLLEHNLSKQVAADLLGHADTAFLERTYCHPQQLYKKVAADIFSGLMEPQDEAYKQKGELIEGTWFATSMPDTAM